MAMDRNVAWKSFQLQSALLCRKTSSDTLAEVRDWLTPKQFYEVVVERNVSGFCGWPMCSCAVTHQSKGTKVDSAEGVQFDLDEFCSPKCHTDVQNFTHQMTANPVGVRSVTQKDVPKATPKIAELLDVFQAIDVDAGAPVAESGIDNDADSRPENPPPQYGVPPVVTHPAAKVKKVSLPESGDVGPEDEESTAEVSNRSLRVTDSSPRSTESVTSVQTERVVLINGVPTSLPVISRGVTGVGAAASPRSAIPVGQETQTPRKSESASSSTASTPSSGGKYRVPKKRPIFLDMPPPTTPIGDTVISLGRGASSKQDPVSLPFDDEGKLSRSIPRVVAKDQTAVDKWFQDAETGPADGNRTGTASSDGTGGVRKVTFSGNDPVPKDVVNADSKQPKAKPARSSAAIIAETAKLAGLIEVNQRGGDPAANAHLYLNASVVENSTPSIALGSVGDVRDSDMGMLPQKHRSMNRKHRDNEPLSKPFEEPGATVPGGGNVPDPRAFLTRMKAVKEQEQKVVDASSEPKFPIGHKRLVPKHQRGKASSHPALIGEVPVTAAAATNAPSGSAGRKPKEAPQELKQTMSSPLLGGAKGVGVYTMHANENKLGDEDEDADILSNAPGSQTKHRLSVEDQKLWQEMFGKDYRSDASDSDPITDDDDDMSSSDDASDDDVDEERVMLTVVEPRPQDRPPVAPKGDGTAPGSPQARLPPHLRGKSLSAVSPAAVVSTPIAASPEAMKKKRSAEKAPKPTHVENNVFKVMWCLLDDLFGHHNSVLQAVIDSDKPAPATHLHDNCDDHDNDHESFADEGSQDEDAGQKQRKLLAMQRAALPAKDNIAVRNSVLNSMVERGLALAEQQLDIRGGFKVLSDSQGMVYHRKKSYLIGSLLAFNSEKSGLGEVRARALMDEITSVEWNMLGLLIVDALFRSVGLLSGISIDDGLSGISTPGHSRSSRALPAPGPPSPKADVSLDPVVATAANVDVLWLAKLDHAFKSLITKYNATNTTNPAGDDISKKSGPDGTKPSMSYRPVQDRELHHLRCYFNG